MGYEFYQRRVGNLKWLTERVHKPYVLWHQKFIDQFIDDRYKGRRRQIKVASELPRNWGKTQCVSIPVPLALWLEFPNLGWGDGSESPEKAAELMLDPQRAILAGNDDNSWFCWLYGVWLKKGAGSGVERRASTQFNLVHEARTDLSIKDQSLRCWGVRSGVTGKHPDGGVMDDPVSEEAIRKNEGWLQLASRHMDSIFYAFAPSSIVFFPHTRYRDTDPAGTRWETEGVCEWAGDPCPDDTIRITPEGQWHVYYLDCYDENNRSKCPEIETTRSLHARESGNPVSFAAQKRNQPGRGEHQLITTSQMRSCLVKKEELPETGFLYLNCKVNFEDLDAVGERASIVSAVLQDPRNNGVVYMLEGHGDHLLRIEDFARLVCRLVVKAQQDVRWRRFRLSGITTQTRTVNQRGSWFSYLRQYAAGMGLALPPLIELPRPKSQDEARVVRTVGYALDKRFKLVDGGTNVHNVMSNLVRYYTLRGLRDDWAGVTADAFDDVIYRKAVTPVLGTPTPYHRRRRGANSNFESDEGNVFDPERGIYDALDIDYL